MKMKLQVGFVIFCLSVWIPVAFGLQCYYCNSRKDGNCLKVDNTTKTVECQDLEVPAVPICAELQFKEKSE